MPRTSLTEALATVKAAGYRVSKPRKKNGASLGGLNAVGKPFSPQYDPNYRRRTPLTSINRLLVPYGNDMQFKK